MSRTHAHRPWWTWLTDARVCHEDHDHTDGPCGLPDPLKQLDAIRTGADGIPSEFATGATRCRWVVDLDLIPPNCGCPMCTGAPWRRADRRRDRHRSHARLSQLAAHLRVIGQLDDVSDLDPMICYRIWKPVVPSGSPVVTCTSVTVARGGPPARIQVSTSSTAALSPSRCARTVLSGSLRTQPTTPRSSACCRVESRNHTPCTRP